MEDTADRLDSERWAHDLLHRVGAKPDTLAWSLPLFAQSICEANRHGRGTWAVQARQGRHPWVYLHVGHHIVAAVVDRGLWLSLDLDSATELGIHLTPTSDLPYWKHSSGGTYDEYPEYKPLGSLNGYYMPSPKHELVWPLIRSLHFASIGKAAAYRALTPGSAELHSSGLLMLVRNQLDTHIPDPQYETDHGL